ncbi:MAG: hypothetical protein HN521_01815 [Candidatus Latescibacteria bacterium]|nr:hypothetical protein [Candidatus Latescibacterota bacterium]
MPSSTSNSNSRCPTAPYAKVWFYVVLLVGLFLTASEFHWRNAGFLPNIVDTKIFWSEHRHQVYTDQEHKKMVIVGSSRAQLGIDPVLLNEHFPEYQVVHLALDGALSTEVIKDLCNDPNFDGIILADLTVPFLCATDAAATQKERDYIHYYHDKFQTNSELEKRLNAQLGASFQSRFVILSPTLSFASLLYTRLNPKQLYVHMQKNRFRPAYYYDRLSEAERIKHRKKRIDGITKNPIAQISTERFTLATQEVLGDHYKKLRKRGGKIVLVRLPTTGEHWQVDQKMAPKTEFWDQLKTLTGIPTVHFKDYKELANFDCPDTSHLDAKDVPTFTNNLGQIVRSSLDDYDLKANHEQNL